MSQGGESINGDLYASYYDNNGSTKTTSTYYNATNYYNYDVQMQPGSSNGQLWVYDAPFCASGSNGQYGTGDRWFNSQNGISTFYDLYDTKLTNDTSDDSLVWSSGNTFKETAAYSDPGPQRFRRELLLQDHHDRHRTRRSRRAGHRSATPAPPVGSTATCAGTSCR